MAIELTDMAVSEIKKQRDQMGMAEAFLRIGVQGGGCGGASYALGLDTDAKGDDYVFDFDGLKVAVDAQSFPMVDGRKLDFINGPMGMGFKFEGPAGMKMGGGCGSGGGGCGCSNEGNGACKDEHGAAEEQEMAGGGCGSGGGGGGGGCGCSH